MARAPFTYPFCYTPAPDIVAAAQELISSLDAAVRSDISAAAAALQEGKMLGVLKVMDEMGREGFLYAFSGTVGGRATLPGFVPPIYDLTAKYTVNTSLNLICIRIS